MNAQSVQPAKSAWKAAFRPRTALLAALALAPLLAATSPASLAQSQSQAQSLSAATDQPIVASLNPPPAGLGCDAAAAATSVYFQFANPPFQISQISLYLDGKGVPQDAIDEHWPTVTLSKGLHPGSNTVDIVANGSSGQHIERRMLVQVGGASSGAAGRAQVSCDDNAAAQQAVQQSLPQPVPQVADAAGDTVNGAWDDQTQYGALASDPAPVAVQDSPPVVYDAPPQVVYDYPPPVYYYTPYPVVDFGPWVPFVPFFSFGFFYSNYHPWFSPPRVVVNNYYGHGPGWNGGGWRGTPGGGGGWRGGGNPAGGAAFREGGNGAAVHAAPRSFGDGGGPGWRGQAPAPAPAPQNRGWQGVPRPAQPSYGQYRSAYSAPAQQYRAPQPQYRPAPQQQFRAAPQQSFRAAAPAFHGGGGGGGGRSAPASHGGGGGRHR